MEPRFRRPLTGASNSEIAHQQDGKAHGHADKNCSNGIISCKPLEDQCSDHSRHRNEHKDDEKHQDRSQNEGHRFPAKEQDGGDDQARQDEGQVQDVDWLRDQASIRDALWYMSRKQGRNDLTEPLSDEDNGYQEKHGGHGLYWRTWAVGTGNFRGRQGRETSQQGIEAETPSAAVYEEQGVEMNGHGDVLVVSHKATIRIILCSLLGIDLGRYRDRIEMLAGSVSIIRFDVYGPLLEVLGDQLGSLPPTYLNRGLPGSAVCDLSTDRQQVSLDLSTVIDKAVITQHFRPSRKDHQYLTSRQSRRHEVV
jgi:Histidine phosphatase superfamily (branch 1)